MVRNVIFSENLADVLHEWSSAATVYPYAMRMKFLDNLVSIVRTIVLVLFQSVFFFFFQSYK